MRESVIEDYLIKSAKNKGYLCYKWTNGNSQNGVPDRILIGHGLTFFVETKAPGETPRKLQEYIHKLIRNHGGIVYVADTKAKIDEMFDQLSSK